MTEPKTFNVLVSLTWRWLEMFCDRACSWRCISSWWCHVWRAGVLPRICHCWSQPPDFLRGSQEASPGKKWIFIRRVKKELFLLTFVLESKLCLSLDNFFLCKGSTLLLRVKRTLTMTMKMMKMTVIETITTMWLGEINQLERASGGQIKLTSLHFPSVNVNN